MRKEISIEETGKTIEEAIDKACKQLGCKRDECSFEIIDRPRKRLFGLRFTPAKVRVSMDMPEDFEEKSPVEEPKPQAKVDTPPKQNSTPNRVAEKQAVPVAPIAPTVEKPVPPKMAPVAPPRATVDPAPREIKGATKEVPLEINPEKVTIATEFVRDVVKGMGIEAALDVRETEEGIFIAVDGNDLGTIIGRRGETLDALQYLTGLVTNRLEGDYLRVTVDSGDYRLKREQTLVELAQRLSEQVLKTNVSKTLEPMSASERRVIHATVAEIEGVSSHSVGSDPGRRVVIKSPTSNARSARRNGSNSGRRSNNGRKSEARNQASPPVSERHEAEKSQPSPVASPASSQKTATPDVVKETPRYGKVDLE